MPTITGTSGNDVITGTQADDTINGSGGNDTIIDAYGDDVIDGGEGDDVIVDEGGSNTIRGGNGNDRITFSDIYSLPGSTIGNPARTNLIEGGAGNDFVTVGRLTRGALTVDMGEGDDILRITSLIPDNSVFRLGAGRDTVLLTYEFGDAVRNNLGILTLADFTAGDAGDILNLGEMVRGLFSSPSVFAAFTEGNPFANGILRLVQDGADTLIQLDYDGSKSNVVAPFTIIRLQDVTASSLTAANFAGLNLAGGAPVVQTVGGTTGNDLIFGPDTGATINGGEGVDEITGGFRADTIEGGIGNDIIDGGAGNDILRGGEGDDLITDEWGNDLIEGGAGNDRILIYRPGVPGVDTVRNETVTINAGDGNDYVRLELDRDNFAPFNQRTLHGVIDLGAGDDVIELTTSALNIVLPTAQITLGTGRDRVIIDSRAPQLGMAVTINDFVVGNAGDILEVAVPLGIVPTWDRVSNPFTGGFLFLEQDGADTLVRLDYDGTGGGSGDGFHFTLVRLVGVTAASLTAANFNGYNPTGTASSFQIRAGTAGNDELVGSFGNDVIEGGDGNDVITEITGGSDILRGGNGNDIIRIATRFSPTADTLTVSGDAGNDLVDFNFNTSSGQTFTANIDLGTGDDRLILRSAPSGGTMITLGSGRDVIELPSGLAGTRIGPITITDFQTGANGDRLDGNLYFESDLSIQDDPDFEAFIQEHMRLVQVGNDTHLQISEQGYSQQFTTFAVFQNTVATSFTIENLGFDPNHATLLGTAANEALGGTANLDVIWAGEGNDTINGLGGDDRLYGEAGNDTINGGDGNDFIRGGVGDDTLRGDEGDDTIDSGGGRDAVFGGGGNDTIYDFGGIDDVDAGTGNDRIEVALSFGLTADGGGEAPGRVLAGDGNDVVTVTDAFFGTGNPSGAANMYSVDLGAGDDVLITDGHFGRITLGAGRDVIQFVEGVDSYGSVVTDFQTGATGDRIDLAGLLGFGLDVFDRSLLDLLRLGGSPFELGIFQLRQAGNDVQLILIPSVSGDFSEELVMTFQNTQVSAFTAENFSGFDPQATPRVPRYIYENTTIGTGESLSLVNTTPDGLVLGGANNGFVYRAVDDSDFINNGSIATIANGPGYGLPIGFGVSRGSSPGADAWFVNSSTGRFIVAADFDDGSGIISFGATLAYGFYAPQQAVHFRNDGYFEVTSQIGSAFGVVTGFDTTATRQFVNNGTLIADGAYGGFAVQLGFGASFLNTGDIAAFGQIEAVGVRWSQYGGGSFVNSGTIFVLNSADSPFFSVGVLLIETPTPEVSPPRVIENSGVISADIAILSADGSPPGQVTNHVRNTGLIEGAILLGFGNDAVFNNGGGEIRGVVLLEQGDDLYDGVGGVLNGSVRGGLGNDTYRIDNVATDIIEEAGEGTDTVETNRDYTLRDNFEVLRLLGFDALAGTGNALANQIFGNAGGNRLTGGLGDDAIDGGSNVDTAVVSGLRSAYTVTQTLTGVFQVTGADGTDTLTAVEFLQFDDQILRLLPGTGVSVNFASADPAVYQSAMNAIRDFDGNVLGGDGGWLRIGEADVNGDGDVDQILVNRTIARFATVGTAPDGLVYFSDHGWAGETRVAGIYVDPLVEAGIVQAGSPFDSQRRFLNDLAIENINRVLGANDYNNDGIHEVYFALTDGTAFLRALMHADGNIRYANYQSQQEVIDYLTANGFGPETYAGWFTAPSSAALTMQDSVDTAEANALGRAALRGENAAMPGSIDPASLVFTAPALDDHLRAEFYG
jgi:Ca2+-binding RTX toxin-like protein